ncbi:hypothetical protein GGH94_001959 [Coemansia aciculifera]|uniref:Coatomer subunit epsilon n=2 Tax=Coemansia TaxID=4863 RepID=A0A9W8GXC2_9FUNG|nr:hypothetical protein GGI19_004949 [Coemansia pectinata]KAJ2865827.1 hypothetical protein GGH94_001959 [Coemansia aciculifera]KAJ2875852.1 hypothetical protein GGH93_001248 [Coemansia aciculifera]KAJ2880289.1 hypothetical protein H4R27_004815 [Coemansia aciculifera]
MSDLVDDFYTARNLLYLGAYPQALSNLSTLPRTVNETERQSLQYRAYLGQGNKALVLSEIPATTPNPTLLAIRNLALLQDPALDLTIDAASLQSPTYTAITAQTLASAGQTDDALRILDMHPRNLECTLLTVAIYLSLSRVDLAQKLVARVRQWAEDAPIAQLAEAWTALAQGGSKYNEAYYVFVELAQASAVSTARLFCSLAVVKLHLGQHEEAQAHLQSALEKDPNDPDTLANLVVCASLTAQSPEVRARYLSQLAHVAPSHPFLRDLELASSRFDSALAAVAK